MRMQMAAFAIFSGIAIGEPLVTGPIVVLLGPPGSGKQTQAAAVAKYLGIPNRFCCGVKTEQRRRITKAQTRGITGMEPETDPLLNKIFEARLERGDVVKGMVLDGYPNTRTMPILHQSWWKQI